MRTWQRATFGVRCGLCNQPVAIGDPILVFRIGTMRRLMLRCPTCADYPAPDDLPPLVERTPVSMTPLVHIRTGANALPFDFRRAQSGEREPGEDG